MKTKVKSEPNNLEESKLRELFINELKDIYWAEKALVKAIPKMAKKTTSPELVEILDEHARETEDQVQKLEHVFEIAGETARAKKCEAMDGLIKEGDEIMKSCDPGAMRDAGIISAAQKIEHYEIASYGTLRTFAEVLGLPDAVTVLEEILEEEKSADEKLTEVATSVINLEAVMETD